MTFTCIAGTAINDIYMIQGRDDIHEKIFPKKNVTPEVGIKQS